MIVERFLQWIGTAPVSRRAEAAHALARAYLHSPLGPAERDGVEAVLTVLLDDPAADVRLALADALGASEAAPPHLVLSLASDRLPIAAIVAERSPLLLDTELVELLATREAAIQRAIARRRSLSFAVAAALAEVGSAEACLDLMRNPGARLTQASLARVVERYGDDPVLRETLLSRDDLPAELRQALVERVAAGLKALLVGLNWLPRSRIETLLRDAQDRAAIAIAADARANEIPALVKRLVEADAMTPALLVRAVAAGQTLLFEEALAGLSGVPADRVSALIASGRAASLEALLEKAGLPPDTFPAFAAAIDVIRTLDAAPGSDNAYRRATHLIDAVVSRYQARSNREVDQILALLRRFAAEARREAARGYVAQVLEAA